MDQIKVEKNISPERLKKLGAEKWSVWEKDVSEFPWSYDQQETCYIIEGEAEVVSQDGSQTAEFEKGDLVFFPEGLECTWKIKEPIKKYYKFG